MDKPTSTRRNLDTASLREFIEWGRETIPATEWLGVELLLEEFLSGKSPDPLHEVHFEEDYLLQLSPPSPSRH